MNNDVTNTGVKEKLLEVLSHFIKIDTIIGKENDILDIDSLILMEIVIEIEGVFDITIKDEEIVTMETFNKMMEVIESKL